MGSLKAQPFNKTEMGITEIITIIIIGIIIIIQIRLFRSNRLRMTEFREIFKESKSWAYQTEDGNVTKIEGKGNKTYLEIQRSINEYLSNNKGSVINFDLLKDAIDRHCDSLEEDISAQTPIPLYCGLVGTMLGVIIGLIPALSSGDFASHTTELLLGVAMAMSASVVGILLTTFNSLGFKQCKLEKERGENSFIVWMQANLLPKLSEDASKAFNKMVRNLNQFNANFAQNSRELKSTLKEVNASYEIQADIIDTIQSLDMMEMARANVTVLTELKDCTDKLQAFNKYIEKLNEFTEQVQVYLTQFSNFQVLENIAQFFKDEIQAIDQRKGEIAKQVGDLDLYLKKSFQQIADTSHNNSEELAVALKKQCDKFNQLAAEQERTFAESSQKIQQMFEEQMRQMPGVAKAMLPLPQKIDNMSQRIEVSNNKLIEAIEQLKNNGGGNGGNNMILLDIASILVIIWMLYKFICWVIELIGMFF